MIPNNLVAHWRELLRLAWLTSIRLGGPATSIPIFGRTIRCIAYVPYYLVPLVAVRAERMCLRGPRGRATVSLQPRWPRRWGWRYWVVLLAGLVLVIMGLTLMMVGTMIIGVVISHAGLTAVGRLLISLAWLPPMLVWVLATVGVGPMWRAAAPRERRLARRWAAANRTTLVEAAGLVVDERDRSAVTVLVRRLLSVADAGSIAITVLPRNERVAGSYRALRFVDVPGGRGRMLLRIPTTGRDSSSSASIHLAQPVPESSDPNMRSDGAVGAQ